MKNLLNKAFVVLFILLLLSGLVKTVFFPKDINYYENRYANQLPPITAEGFLDKTLQAGVDDALMDQIPLAQTAKKIYNTVTMRFKAVLTDVVLRTMLTDQYVNLGKILVYGGDHYVYSPMTYDTSADAYADRVSNINTLIRELPQVQFYTWYIEKETDINFVTGKKTGIGDRVLEQIDLPDAYKGFFRVDSFEQFHREFFRTDTHWNQAGAYRGYTALLSLLMPEERPLQPGAEQLVCGRFSGNKAATNGASGVWTEEFYAYTYDFPAMDITINGQPAADYGTQNTFGLKDTTYGLYYGGDEGEVIFRNPTGNGKKFLLVGESYDNAILKLLASHTSELYSIDLRNYEAKVGKPFDLVSYLEEHAIDNVVLLGNMDYYRGENFNMEVVK